MSSGVLTNRISLVLFLLAVAVVDRFSSYRATVKDQFDGSTHASRALSRATGAFMQKDLGVKGTRVSLERLASDHMHRILKSGYKGPDPESQLNACLDLIPSLTQKDRFLRCYGDLL